MFFYDAAILFCALVFVFFCFSKVCMVIASSLVRGSECHQAQWKDGPCQAHVLDFYGHVHRVGLLCTVLRDGNHPWSDRIRIGTTDSRPRVLTRSDCDRMTYVVVVFFC